MESLFNLFDPSKMGNIGIITHIVGDPDAICGAAALQALIKIKVPDSNCLIFCDQWTDMSDNIIENLNLDIKDKPLNEKIDLAILFDVNTIELLGIFKKLITPETQIIIIDHHAPYPELSELTNKFIIEQQYTSASEIIYDQFILNEIKITNKIAFLLLLGIGFDSRHLTIANGLTLKKVSHLTELGANLDEMKTFLSKKMDYSEKVARIKAAQRSKIEKLNDWIIIFSHVSAFEASACRGLLELGADVAFVLAEEKGEVRVSARASQDFNANSGIHLGEDVMRHLGKFIGGTGGGHSAAAACRGNNNAKKVNSKIIELINEKFKEKKD